MKLFCHRATVGGLVAQHDDKILVIDEDAEVVLDDEPTGRNPGIHSILRPAIRIPIGPDNDLGQSINESFLPFMTVSKILKMGSKQNWLKARSTPSSAVLVHFLVLALKKESPWSDC